MAATPGSIHEDLTLASRFECKYLIDPLIVPGVRSFIRPFTVPDPYAARAPGRRYEVASLYLDSDDLALYRQAAAGERDRFKLRVRTYSDGAHAPVFFEVKSRINSIVSKRRACLTRDEATHWLRSGSPNGALGAGDPRLADADFFWSRQALIGARPVLRVRYKREAYESSAGDPVRVTLDNELMHSVTFGDELGFAGGRWARTPVPGVVLELKFTERFPTWIGELVRHFGLCQRAVPKYGTGLEHVLERSRGAVLALAGFTLPPQGA